MLKAMVSQPMAGKTNSEILKIRSKAIQELKDSGYETVGSFFCNEWATKEHMEESGTVNVPVRFLSMSLEAMSRCHAVYFCKGWEQARGCRIEHDVAEAYGMTIFEE